MSIKVLRAFEDAKCALDGLFGEGYAAANPLLVDRFVQSALKNDRRSDTTSAFNVSEGVYSDFIDVMASALSKGEIAPGVPFERVVFCETIYRALADAMNEPFDSMFSARAGKFIAKVFGSDVKKKKGPRNTQVATLPYRPHIYAFTDLDTVVRVFEDNTGVRVIKGAKP